MNMSVGKPLGKPRRSLEKNIKINVEKISCVGWDVYGTGSESCPVRSVLIGLYRC
jgi:hypothetical protein